jgi:hypothetical protein
VVSAVALGDLDHTEIDIRAEASVEADLFLAVGAAELKCREVQKAEIYRLLELVCVRACKDNPRAMGFVEAQIGCGMRVGPGIQEVSDELWLSVKPCRDHDLQHN